MSRNRKGRECLEYPALTGESRDNHEPTFCGQCAKDGYENQAKEKPVVLANNRLQRYATSLLRRLAEVNMAQEFGNVKGFSDALSYLDDEEKAHLLSLITDKDMLMQEAQDRHIFCEPPKKWMASFALAVIYHANNGAE